MIHSGRVPPRPWPTDDAYSVAEDTELRVAAPGVLGNDTYADRDALRATLVSEPAHGHLSLNADGSFTYMPDANFNGTDQFTYQSQRWRADLQRRNGDRHGKRGHRIHPCRTWNDAYLCHGGYALDGAGAGGPRQ